MKIQNKNILHFVSAMCFGNKSYLEYRKRNGDRLKPSEPLLRDEFDINDQIRAASPKTLSTFSLRARIFRLLVSSGVRERKPELEKVPSGETKPDTRPQYDRREVMQCHGSRKFFSTTCTSSRFASSDSGGPNGT